MTQSLQEDEWFMRRALELAKLGRGFVSPNPLVGCVIVNDGKIIGEGWHKQYGESHAEINALNAVADKNVLSNATVYVTLEPCSHFGKTPPCADRLVQEKVKRVVVCNLDSNPLVAGRGIQKLKDVGIEVTTGILDDEGRILNKRFFTFMEKQRPYIILKWAKTADGFIARENGDSKWISDQYSRQLVHKWRTEEDAILVGTSTALYDNPRLNVRDWTGRDPVRIVIDRALKLKNNLHLFDQQQRTIRYNLIKDEVHNNLIDVKLSSDNFLKDMLADLFKQNIQSVIVEGGTFTLQTFMDAGLWDEARVFVSPVTFGKGINAPELNGIPLKTYALKNDQLHIYVNSQ